MVKPSPFCLLDEFGRAARRVNIGVHRPAEEIRSDRSSIIITHKNAPCPRASAIMCDDGGGGVSKTVSMRFHHEPRRA